MAEQREQQPIAPKRRRTADPGANALMREHGLTRDQAERLLRKYRTRPERLKAAIEVLKSR